ncbi:MAG: hypothetical protein QOE90_22 [Thermoplasmata archaeon]|jgi:hypothetical protein|nr:hypothetical protein [Thermoplasmata archaeon]
MRRLSILALALLVGSTFVVLAMPAGSATCAGLADTADAKCIGVYSDGTQNCIGFYGDTHPPWNALNCGGVDVPNLTNHCVEGICQ